MTSKKEYTYQIEALEEEIKDLKSEIVENHTKLWDIIQENDRLTMTYEPYRPPGDEDEGVNFYDLIEENKELRAEVAGLKIKLYLDDQLPIKPFKDEKLKKKERIKNDRWWNFSIELWPGAWGLNYYRYNWKKSGSQSREGQMQIGPFGLSWNREPKRQLTT